MVAVIGDAKLEADDPKVALAEQVGRLLVESGFRVVTGGLGGVMAAAMRGARKASNYAEGDTLGILPGYDPVAADEAADIVIATGLGLARNALVVNADAVIIIGGGAGTLSEMALAWQLRRPLISLVAEGWGGTLGNTRLDARQRQPGVAHDQIHTSDSPEAAVQLAVELIPRHRRRKGEVS